jgi:hypothetical protein
MASYTDTKSIRKYASEKKGLTGAFLTFGEDSSRPFRFAWAQVDFNDPSLVFIG